MEGAMVVKKKTHPRRERGLGSIYQPKFKGPDGRECKGNLRIRFTYRDELGVRHVHDEKVEGPEVNKSVAQALLNKRRAELANGKFVFDTPAETLTYKDLRGLLMRHYEDRACKSLHTAKNGTKYIYSLSHLDNFFGPTVRALAIKVPLIETFKDARKEKGASNVSINRSLSLLRQMFSVAVEKTGFPLDRVPKITMLAEPPARKGFLEYDAFFGLREALPEYLRVPVTVGYLTGMRLSEIMNLRWEYVSTRKRVIQLPPGYCKNDEPRTIPLIGELPDMLAIVREQNPGAQFVFMRNGLRLHSFRKAWNTACIATGLGVREPRLDATGAPVMKKKKPVTRYRGLIFHDLRRSAVTNLVQAGVDPLTAMAISGHKTTSIFKRYNITTDRHLQAAGRKVEEYLTTVIQSQSKVEGLQGASQPCKNIN